MEGINLVLAAAIEFERFGREYYLRFHELVADTKAKALMKGLAHDEEEHAAILTKELEAQGASAELPPREMLEEGLAKIFPHSILRNSIETKDAISAIKLGIETEQRSIDFYSEQAEVAEGGLKETFAMLAKMEREHLELLQENLEHLQEDGVWYGYVPILEG
ncbi:MAG: ferritin family protein [Methanobacteriota archaeon]|nr:MAG: ferritin family protein [Euryarchaeota archaeon]